MTIEINGQIYYRTSETCKEIGISRATLFRWIKEGALKKSRTDRRGWRLFTEGEVKALKLEINRIIEK